MPQLARIILIVVFIAGSVSGEDSTRSADHSWNEVSRIFARHCLECHGPDREHQEAGLRLDARGSATSTLDSGSIAVVPGAPEQSEVLHRITAHDDTRMPPADVGTGLTEAEVSTITEWIRAGANWGTHWSLIAPVDHGLPDVRDQTWGDQPLDRFVQRRIEENGFKLHEIADRRTLIRRVHFDLIGLPPTPTRVEQFQNDESPDAWRKVIDELLATPLYGQRWGRHWLDVARYGDSNGSDENHAYPLAWRYRNYVIDAFNNDIPFDQFVREQLAGDLLPNDGRKYEAVTATGFLAIGTKILAEKDPVKKQADMVDEQINTVGTALLGFTVACARCHDHKFDPIPTTDYYALAGILHSTKLEDRALETQEYLDAKASFDQRLAALEEARQRLETKDDLAELETQITKLHEQAPQPARAMAVAEGQPHDVQVHLRGSHLSPGDEVRRGFPVTALTGARHSDTDNSPFRIADTQSGRLQLARWMTDTESGAGRHVARVFVNRVWQWHFGRGLAATPNNVGLQGQPPTHPQLLDWLTMRFIEDGWSVKSLHRRILMSTTWRQQSVSTPNDRWSGYSRRRMEAEVIRDTLLFHSGRLDTAPAEGLEGVKSQDPSPEDLSNNEDFHRRSPKRSVYLPVIRSNAYRFFSLFDFPNATTSVGKRDITTVPTQALLLMNDSFVMDQAQHFAKAILTENGESRLLEVYRRLFSRQPTSAEKQAAAEFLSDFAATTAGSSSDELEIWSAFCHSLMASSEFIYVE